MNLFGYENAFAKKRAAHIRLGQKGERIARRLLLDLGLQILTRNFAGPHGEIDLIARDGQILCFVEVKTRRYSKRSRPADAVTLKKKKNIVRTANRYLRQLGNPPLVYRYDIVEVVFTGQNVIDARYWVNEFSSEGVIANQ